MSKRQGTFRQSGKGAVRSRGLRSLLPALLAVWLGVLGGAGPGVVVARAAERDASKVGLAVISSITAMPVYVAQEKGYFQEEGLSVQVVRVEAGPASLQAVIAGSLDAAHSGTIPFLLATARGAPLVSVMTTAKFEKGRSANAIIVRRDANIRSVHDLKGKLVAVHSRGSIEDIRLRAEMFPAEGIREQDVRIVELPFPNMEQALVARRVDAVVTFEPYTSKLKANPSLQALTDLDEYLPSSGYPQSTYVFAASFVRENGPVVDRFVLALVRSLRLFREAPGEVIRITAAAVGLPEPLVREALGNVPFSEDGYQDLEAYRILVKEMQAVGLLPSTYSPEPFIRQVPR